MDQIYIHFPRQSLLGWICLAVLFCGCGSKPTPALTPITIQLQWTHQAEFAGLYAADQLGYYAAEGLAPTFIQGGVDIDNLAVVLEGKAQFGVATADQLIVARAEGKLPRAIAVIYRRSPTVFMTLASSDITHPQDFVGKTIRAPLTLVPTLHAMTTRVGVTPDQYTEVILPSDVAMFASGAVPIWGGYINGLTIAIQQAGYAINIIYPDDYGVHFYADALFTTDNFINTNPDMILRFLRASLQGWTYAVEHSAEIGPMVVKYESKVDPSLENAKMAASIPLVNTGEDHIGWMKPETWAGMEQTLREQGVISAPLDVTQVYTLRFLEEIYK